jgi:hypothetical protein
MADFLVGQTIHDYFTAKDSDGDNLTGVIFDAGSTEDPLGDSFSLVVTEIGDGVYRVSFTPDRAGIWYYRIDSTNITPAQSWEENFTVATGAGTVISLDEAASGATLNELIKWVAVRSSDFLQIEATAAGSVDGTSFEDNLRLAAIPSQALSGASITFVSPDTSDNYLIERRISDFSEDTQVATITPAFPAQISTGDEAWVTNLRSKGHWRSEYINAINLAIAAAFPQNLVKVEYTHGTVWDQDEPYISLDSSLTHVYGVRVDDGVQTPYLIPASAQNNGAYPGWFYDFGLGQLGITTYLSQSIHGTTVSVLGYGRAAPLVDADDRTPVDAEWISFYAAEILKGGTGDQKLLSQASRMENRGDVMRPKIISGLEPGTIQIR